MTILETLRPYFDSAVRNRGEDYARSGAVHLVEHDGEAVEMEVDGSGGWHYLVSLDRVSPTEFDLDCTCPHFEDGNFCKHLWAAARMAQEWGLFSGTEAPPASSTNGRARGGAATPSAGASKPPSWQKQLERHAHFLKREAAPAAPSRADRRVIYLLEATDDGAQPVITLGQQLRKKDGAWGVCKALSVDHRSVGSVGDSKDRDALTLLIGNRTETPRPGWMGYGGGYNASVSTRVEVAAPLFATVLPALAATGRLMWVLSLDQYIEDAHPLAWDGGDPWRFRLNATAADRGKQWRLTGELVRGDQVRPVAEAVRCYETGLVLIDDKLGPFETPADYRWVELLRANDALVVPHSEREALLKELWRAGHAPDVIGDESLKIPCETATPVGRLEVHPPAPGRRSGNTLYASVAYRYGDHECTPHGSDAAWPLEGGARMATRDRRAEAALYNRLFDLGLRTKEESRYGDSPRGHLQFPPALLSSVVEVLIGEGWQVEAEGALVRRGENLSVSVSSGVDWFDLEGAADFDGVSVELPELLAAVRAGERYIKLGDGTRGLLPQAWLDRYASLAELSTPGEGGAVRFQTGQALLLDSLLSARESEIDVKVDRQFSAWRKRLRSFTGVKPAAAPRAFRGELRDYQREGLGWLKFLEKFGFGGCLADDMGLGKTIQVLALLADRNRRQPKEAERRPSLVVAPKSLVYNWRLEAQKFAPNLRVADYTGLDRKTRVGDFAEHDVVLTTYGTLRRDAAELGAAAWDYAVLDEAQAIKNAASQSAKASRLINARHRLALSGTPVENHLGELWSIFEFLNPGLLGKSQTLTRLASGGAGPGDNERFQALRQGLAPFLLRRTKAQVLPQLPKKSEQHLYCELPPAQRKQYNQLRDHYRQSLTSRIAERGLAKSKIHVLEALLRLRQAACHPGLIDARQKKKPSAKLDLLMEQLGEVLGEGHKALVFSQFTTMLGIVRDRLDKAGVVYEYLDGKTRDRQARVERFQADKNCQAFLISLKAGGVGLNLTAAEYVYILDPWWNPAVEAQAIDRAHRIGQEQPVFAYRLIAQDTVEEKIIEMQTHKKELADAIISEDSSLLKRLSAEDLQALLA
ncbi:ATP-dependent helicase HepA [Pirellulimonas nuda]|uniref:ATP-dependent helicase HepA n=1 Tax=Pirellulimonas nuda TaxID=2528009 RepID=A0A518DJU7_9BACT|nr:DEAD/DEAH box helicase [Pirellulimonas nuda]QDU91747.1 ATP-dependent helicase HepA [Pirellulimonas nuda]